MNASHQQLQLLVDLFKCRYSCRFLYCPIQEYNSGLALTIAYTNKFDMLPYVTDVSYSPTDWGVQMLEWRLGIGSFGSLSTAQGRKFKLKRIVERWSICNNQLKKPFMISSFHWNNSLIAGPNHICCIQRNHEAPHVSYVDHLHIKVMVSELDSRQLCLCFNLKIIKEYFLTLMVWMTVVVAHPWWTICGLQLSRSKKMRLLSTAHCSLIYVNQELILRNLRFLSFFPHRTYGSWCLPPSSCKGPQARGCDIFPHMTSFKHFIIMTL